MTVDPDLHLVVDGMRLDAEEQQGAVYVFRLPSSPKSVVIASREIVPAEFGIARNPRSLGVALRRVATRQSSKFVVFNADDKRLTAGFHDYEPSDWRALDRRPRGTTRRGLRAVRQGRGSDAAPGRRDTVSG
jgi:hypothetical protein